MGVLYRVFDYGDELQVNEIHGRAIIQQLVCIRYCYSILMPRGLIDPSCRERAVRERGNRFQTQPNWESTPTLSLFFAGQRGGVARRSRLWNATSPDRSCTVQIVPTCPACTTGVSRWQARKKRAVRRGEKKKEKERKEEKERRKNVKEEIALSRHWSASCDSLGLIRMWKNCDFARMITVHAL